MADDIVTRLRTTDYEYEDAELAFDAADEIERLRALIAEWHSAESECRYRSDIGKWWIASQRLNAAEDALHEEAARG